MNIFRQALALLVTMIVLTGAIYPLIILAIGQIAFPVKSNGSLLQVEGKTVGSILIAQQFKRPSYFQPRPSAIDYNPMKPSGGSNLGPISQKLKETVQERLQALTKENPGSEVPSEMVYASGSGLDPHISLKAAYFQMERITKARGLTDSSLIKNLIDSLVEGQQGGFIGPQYVNVLLLNQNLDQKFPGKKTP